MSARESANYTSIAAELFQLRCYSSNSAGNLLPASRGAAKQEILKEFVYRFGNRERQYTLRYGSETESTATSNTATRAVGAE